jgi:pimeloyl-ACP methyl ester carboxylesterase
MSYLNVNGFTMWYEVRGRGRPVLFIHGGFAGLPSRLQPRDYHWLDEMAQGYRLIVYHRRGCGWSSCPSQGWSLRQQVDDALALLAHSGVEETHVVGSSAGGPIAIMLALARPQMVRSLVLANTAPRLLSEGELARSLPIWLKELEERGPLAFYRARPREARVSVLGPWERATAQRLGTLPELEEYEEKLSAAAQALPEEEQAALYAAEVRNLAAYLEVDLLPQLKELRMPVLIVHGDQDQVVPLRAAYDLHRAIPGSTLEVFPGVPHGILGFSREARLRILQFLREVDEGRVGGG